MGWNKNKPGNSDKISLSAATIRGNFKAIEDDTLTIPMKGIRLKKQTSNPTPVATNGFIYTKEVVVGADTDTELYYEDADGSVSKMTRKGKVNPFGVGIVGIARVSTAGAIVGTSYNLTVASHITGVTTFTLTDPAADANYSVIASLEGNFGSGYFIRYTVTNSSTFVVRTSDFSDISTNKPFSVVVFSATSQGS